MDRYIPGLLIEPIKADLQLTDTQIGLLLGPTTIALLNDNVFGVDGIRYSMALLPALYGIPVLLMGGYIRRQFLTRQAHYALLGQD